MYWQCDCEASITKRLWPTTGCSDMEKKNLTSKNIVIYHNLNNEPLLLVNILFSVPYYTLVQFRSFRTKHALMCQIHEQDKLSVLKHVLCNLMSVSEFFDMKMLGIVIIKKK